MASADAPMISNQRHTDGLGPADLDEEFVASQRDALRAERESLLAQAERLQADAEDLKDTGPAEVQFDEESGEGTSAHVDADRQLALRAQLLASVTEIDEALERIEQGTYGVCVRCGRPIGSARLEALPHATLCISCKSPGPLRRR